MTSIYNMYVIKHNALQHSYLIQFDTHAFLQDVLNAIATRGALPRSGGGRCHPERPGAKRRDRFGDSEGGRARRLDFQWPGH